MKRACSFIAVFGAVLSLNTIIARPFGIFGQRSNNNSHNTTVRPQTTRPTDTRTATSVRPQAVQPQPVSKPAMKDDNYITKYVPGGFQYQNEDGEWKNASFEDDKTGPFYTNDSKTQMGFAEEGDVKFLVGDEWYLAKKDSIERPMMNASTDTAQVVVESARRDLGTYVNWASKCFGPIQKYLGGQPSEKTRVGTFSNGNPQKIQLEPGQVMKWNNANFGGVHGASHWSIIDKVWPDGRIDIIHQNMRGSPMIRQTVNPYTMSGNFVVYQP